MVSLSTLLATLLGVAFLAALVVIDRLWRGHDRLQRQLRRTTADADELKKRLVDATHKSAQAARELAHARQALLARSVPAAASAAPASVPADIEVETMDFERTIVLL
jgi:hypothetical protein